MKKSSVPTYRNQAERKYWALGIPFYTWEVTLKSLPFRQCTFLGENLLPRVQRTALKQVADEPRRQIICISSATSDRNAIAAGCWMLMVTADYGGNVALVNAAEDFSPENKLNAICIHNVMANATPARCEQVRDLVFRYNSCPRIIIVNGTDNPDQFCRTRLGLYPTFCCRVDDK